MRREPANKVCPNCLKEDKLGFDAVCFQFKTFVCSTCKSSHQAYSHRCKSVRMSNWTKEEVDTLKTENGGGARGATLRAAFLFCVPRSDMPRLCEPSHSPGCLEPNVTLRPFCGFPSTHTGNAVCIATWLGNLEMRGGRRPAVGSEDRFFKQFVDAAYNQRAYFKAGGRASPASMSSCCCSSCEACADRGLSARRRASLAVLTWPNRSDRARVLCVRAFRRCARRPAE